MRVGWIVCVWWWGAGGGCAWVSGWVVGGGGGPCAVLASAGGGVTSWVDVGGRGCDIAGGGAVAWGLPG